MTPDELLAQHNGDAAHAHHVADLALAIFVGSAALHDGKPKARRLLEAGAILHNVALDHDERRHHTLGRDIVLGAALDGTSDDERAMIACLVAFHRKKVPRRDERAEHARLEGVVVGIVVLLPQQDVPVQPAQQLGLVDEARRTHAPDATDERVITPEAGRPGNGRPRDRERCRGSRSTRRGRGTGERRGAVDGRNRRADKRKATLHPAHSSRTAHP